MDRQIIISIGREYGTCGREIALQLSKKLGIKLYDKDLLNNLVEEHGIDPEIVKKYDEKPKNPLFARNVMGYSNSIEEVLAGKVFKYEKKLADSGESFVIVGRCSDFVLRDAPNIIRIFITGDMDQKIKRIMKAYDLTERDAADVITKADKTRKTYHNYHCDTKWGDSRAYDLTINTSKLGIERTVEVLYNYILANLSVNVK